MLTIDEIRNIQFTRGIGGYKTAEVDVFVDEVIDTVTALTAERDENKTKMNVLAEKLLEYRQEEETIHTALLSAQKMGNIVMKDAHARADQLIAEAKEKAAQIEKIARREIQDEQDRLEALKQQVADFQAHLLELYREHLALIQNLPVPEKAEETEPAPTEEYVPAEEPAVVQEVAEAATVDEPVPAPEPEQAPTEPVIEDMSSGKEEGVNLSFLQLAESPAEETPSSKFADLRFGSSYHIEDELDDEDEEDKPRRFRKKNK